jgi:hypothetical protein
MSRQALHVGGLLSHGKHEKKSEIRTMQGSHTDKEKMTLHNTCALPHTWTPQALPTRPHMVHPSAVATLSALTPHHPLQPIKVNFCVNTHRSLDGSTQ